jgi:hypothetical protein
MAESQEMMFGNFRKINATVRRYYDAHPDALQGNKEKISNITDLGYDARVFATDQGIGFLDVKMKEAKIGETLQNTVRGRWIPRGLKAL